MDHFGQYILNDIMKIDGADIVYEWCVRSHF
jgi:hypothetical protein